MGRDKAFLPLPGSGQVTFVEHLVSLLSTYCHEVVLVARDAKQAAAFAFPGVQVVTDEIPDIGPLMGLYSALRVIQSSHALLTAVDMPFVQPAMIEFLLSQSPGESLLVPVVEQVPQVLLAVYPRSILPIIEERLRAGNRGPRFLLDVAPVRYIDEAQLRKIDPQLRSFVNVNTPEELSGLM